VTQRAAELMTKTVTQRLRMGIHWGLSSESKVTRYESTATLLGDPFVSPAPSIMGSSVNVLVNIASGDVSGHRRERWKAMQEMGGRCKREQK